jgi:hypothetical protein
MGTRWRPVLFGRPDQKRHGKGSPEGGRFAPEGGGSSPQKGDVYPSKHDEIKKAQADRHDMYEDMPGPEDDRWKVGDKGTHGTVVSVGWKGDGTKGSPYTKKGDDGRKVEVFRDGDEWVMYVDDMGSGQGMVHGGSYPSVSKAIQAAENETSLSEAEKDAMAARMRGDAHWNDQINREKALAEEEGEELPMAPMAEWDEEEQGKPRPSASLPKPGAREVGGTIQIDHEAYPRYAATLSDGELRYTIKDAGEALASMPDSPKAGYYADEIHYAAMELAKRTRGAE